LASGDEFYNWLHDKNSSTIIRSSANGYYMYAQKLQGTLVTTTFIAGRTDPAVLEVAGIRSARADQEATITESLRIWFATNA
jgi:hypothetical protein